MALRTTYRAHTLPELLLVLCIVATLLTVAVQGVGPLVHRSQLHASKDALLASLHMARREAIRRNGRVVMCKSADGVACSQLGDWSQGWIIFHDRNNNLRLDPDGAERVLYQEGRLAARVLISTNRPLRHYVSFGAHGRALLESGGFQAGTFTLCAIAVPDGRAYQIPVQRSGRTRVVTIPQTNCPPTSAELRPPAS